MTDGMCQNDGNALLLALGKTQIDNLFKMQTDDSALLPRVRKLGYTDWNVKPIGHDCVWPGSPADAEGNFLPLPQWLPGQPQPPDWPSHIHRPRNVDIREKETV